MKHDETQTYAHDIPRQRSPRKIQPMNAQTFTLSQTTAWLPGNLSWFAAFGALLLCVGAVQAGEPESASVELALECQNRKPYGSGYEARGLGEPRKGTDVLTLDLPDPAVGNSNASTGRAGAGGFGAGSRGNSGGGSGGGSGGSGGRGR